jgi:hypothetical protein
VVASLPVGSDERAAAEQSLYQAQLVMKGAVGLYKLESAWFLQP